jgi:phosphatidylserine/phosphatidylglycerophosphate/cardiolipin synthase-like enzyme
VKRAIADARARGVAVRVLLNDPAFDEGDSSSAVALFQSVGVLVRHSVIPLFIHAKFIMADGAYAFVGSENFSFTSLNRNREAGIVVSEDAPRLGQAFSADWARSAPFVP